MVCDLWWWILFLYFLVTISCDITIKWSEYRTISSLITKTNIDFAFEIKITLYIYNLKILATKLTKTEFLLTQYQLIIISNFSCIRIELAFNFVNHFVLRFLGLFCIRIELVLLYIAYSTCMLRLRFYLWLTCIRIELALLLTIRCWGSWDWTDVNSMSVNFSILI